MSSYTNVTVPNRHKIDQDNRENVIRQEAIFWRNFAYELLGTLSNIPLAVAEHGYVDISLPGGATMRLVTPPVENKAQVPEVCAVCEKRGQEDLDRKNRQAEARRKAAEPRKVTPISKGKRRGK